MIIYLFFIFICTIVTIIIEKGPYIKTTNVYCVQEYDYNTFKPE